MDLSERVAVITGASRGIGAGMLDEFLARGMRVAACARGAIDRSSDRLLTSRVDVTDRDALADFGEQAARRFGRIDLWINNAGILEPIAPLRDVDLDALRQLIDVNVLGVAYGSRWFARHVRSREGGGVLINISSGAATSAYAGWSAYCASKAAVDRLTECVQLEEGDAGLRAHAVAPGIVDTHMQEMIRGTDRSRFPMVDKFIEFKRDDAFNRPQFVARELLKVAFDEPHPSEVVLRLRSEKA